MAGFPTQARAIVIGGGIVGCSTAYHLAALGWREVVLLERAKLTSGSAYCDRLLGCRRPAHG